jgi:hypothetical protein
VTAIPEGLGVRFAALEARIERLELSRRLESASIGAGGLEVVGGSIVIKDAGGATVMTLSTAGMTLTGLLEVLGGLTIQAEAEIRWYDADDVLRFEIGRRDEGTFDNIQLVYTDALLATRIVLGEYESGGGTVNGLLVLGPDGDTQLAINEDEVVLGLADSAFGAFVLKIDESLGIRVAVKTAADGIQIGQVTAGATNTGGTGYRLLRIPN